MRKLDTLGDGKRGDSYHRYAIDINKRDATGETCCSITGKGAQCDGYADPQKAKEAGAEWNKTRTT